MKRRILLLFALVTLAASFVGAQVNDPSQIVTPPLPEFKPKVPKRIQLPNGMVIFLQENHELPLIDGIARIRGGSRSVPAAKTGMLDIYGEVWRTGGTKTQTGDELDDYLEVRAAKVETDGNIDSTTIGLSCLKADFDDVFKAFVDVLRNPEFREDKIKLAHDEMFDAISRRNDSAGQIAARESAKLAYGANSPYARVPEYATVDAVTRQDLLDWHHAHVYPNNIILGLVGDFDSAAMEAKLRQAFGAWTKGPALPKDDAPIQPAKPGYYLVPKDDVNQSAIRMSEAGIRRDNPDYYAVEVMNEAFGGGFSSRLIGSIRTAKGLAYAVGGGVGSSFDHNGVTRLVMGTKSGSTVEAIQALYAEVEGIASKPFTDVEIKRAKDSILNSFVFNFDTPDKVLRERMAYEFYGYPSDFLERYRSAIEKVTKEDVARVAAKYLHKDQFAVLVVGNTADFDKPLSSLGAVTNVDITIPPPPGEKSEPQAEKPAASNPEGKALAAKVVAALGGADKLKAVKSVRSELNVTQKTPQGDIALTSQTVLVFPDHVAATIQSPMGAVTMVATPQAGFMSAPGMGQRDIPSGQKTEMLSQVKRDLIFIGQHVDDSGFVFAAGGAEKIGDINAQILDVSCEGMSMRMYVDPQSGRVLRETYDTVGRTGPAKGQTDLEDWQTSDGLTLPRVRKNKQNGEDSSTVQVTKVEFNPTVDPKIFEKPAEKPTQ